MEEIEGSEISTSSVAPKVWKRYVDDRFCIIKKDEIRLPQHTQHFGSSDLHYY